MSDPEISFGSGKSLIVLKGRESIRAAGWALRYLLFARATMMLMLSGGGIGGVLALAKWWMN
jgi:hypothetical protein